jgi:hypothetical protein
MRRRVAVRAAEFGLQKAWKSLKFGDSENPQFAKNGGCINDQL